MNILHFFWSKRLILNKNSLSLNTLAVFCRNNSNGCKRHSLKIRAWSVYFSRFHRYWKFKIQRNKSERCKTKTKKLSQKSCSDFSLKWWILTVQTSRTTFIVSLAVFFSVMKTARSFIVQIIKLWLYHSRHVIMHLQNSVIIYWKLSKCILTLRTFRELWAINVIS